MFFSEHSVLLKFLQNIQSLNFVQTFSLFINQCEWHRIFLGGSSPAAIKNAGQYIAWNLVRQQSSYMDNIKKL